jgi:hypothetical protein
MGAGNKKPAGEITSRRQNPSSGLIDADQTSDLKWLRSQNCENEELLAPPAVVFLCPRGRMLFCAMNAGSSKTPRQLRGGTSFALAVSSNCIEDNLSRIFGILTCSDFMP